MMIKNKKPAVGETAGYLNLHRLFMLRNFAIIGQLAATYTAQVYLQISLPILSIGIIILVLASFNLLTLLRLRFGGQVSSLEFLLQLLVDVLILTGLLYLTGGASNPFVLMFLLPIIIATAVLPARYIWVLTVITAACYSLLIWKYLPLPHSHNAANGFSQHVFGMWLSFVISAAVTAYFVVAMRRTLRSKDKELASAREKQLRDEQLVLIGTLAASTAHEMGTPLGTMALLCDELSHDLGEDHKKIISTLNEQISRCKKALANLAASTGTTLLTGGQVLTVDVFLDKLLNEWKKTQPNINIEIKWTGLTPAPSILSDRTLTQALSNILDNAVDASPKQVEWFADWDSSLLTMHINDRGEGLTPEAEQAIGHYPFTAKSEGLGLGLFLAHSIITRFDGEVKLFNRKHGGVSTLIKLPVSFQIADSKS